MWAWVTDHETFVVWLFVASAAMFLGTLVVLPILIVRMPADYFLYRRPPAKSWRSRHGVMRWTVLILKNLLGLLLLAAGLVMLLGPGQGILAILVGLSLLDVPGKRKLELRLIRSRPVLKAINWVRAKYHRPPLKLPDRPVK
jgi:hypothetical protein